ncbi:hypothetical protein OHC33_003262 [Knufia fluminis]|uniref:GATA-type domain-containing protein n=1 Tax=Knufia fluminis TaxID=191047 RepID=A0AAN8EX84_9EURO|nr:hypothetical protein OHC33_003262 [Knufia fluminis]
MAEEEGATIAVKLKVHYTFDAEHKVDHLSRPPQSFQVQSAPLDDTTTIGIIDLRSCLDSVITSSPELTHFHESDFTVYAYDYSEPNTPLVGQGMLSKVLTCDGDANEAMVTGRITQSVMAKFKKNVEPFLEVKLRFTPIASSMQRGRSGSMSSVTEGVQSQFSGFSSVGPMGMERPHSPAEMARLDNVQRTLHEGGPRRDSFYNNSFGYSASSRPSSRPGTPTYYQQYPPPQPGSTHSRTGSHFMTYQQLPPAHARRGSESGYWSADEGFEEGPAKKRARVTKVQRAKKHDFNIEQQASSLRTAAMGASSLRIHQPTPMNPTAALQRGLSTEEPVRPPTPIAKPGRKPTGRPRGRPPKAKRAEAIQTSSPTKNGSPPPPVPDSNMSSPEETRERLHNGSTMSSPADLPSSPPILAGGGETSDTSPKLPEQPVQPAQIDGNHDSGFFSAQIDSAQIEEDGSKEGDLFGGDMNIPFDGDWSQLFDPSLTAHMDSGQEQMVEGPENHYTPVFDEQSTYEGPTPQPEAAPGTAPTPTPQPEMGPKPDLPPTEQQEAAREGASASTVDPVPQKIPVPTLQQSSQAQQEATNQPEFQRPSLPPPSASQQQVTTDKNGRPIPTLLPRPPPAPTYQRSQSVLPPVPASDPGTRPFQRSMTWAPDISDAIMSDATGPEDGKGKARKRVGKDQTRARLDSAIATGGMPPYCHNCGAIETPAWRRGFIKHFTCPFESVETSLNSGEMCYKQVIERNSDGSVKLWKGWKVERKEHDDWEQINLCNPCGLWFHKQKTPRPPEKWQRKDRKEKRQRKRPPKPPKSRVQPPRSAAGNLTSDMPESDAQEPGSEDSSPADTSAEDGADDNNDAMTVDGGDAVDCQEPELPPMPKSMSAQLGRRTVMFADVDVRQVKSSPLARGTAAEPINVDLTPNKPLRRVLFPSPGSNKPELQEALPLFEKTNEALLPSVVRRSPRLNKTRDIFSDGPVPSLVTVEGAADDAGKENLTPRAAINYGFDELDDLFGDNNEEMPPPPMTPTPKRRSERISARTPQANKTPSREFGAEISGNSQKTPRAAKTPTRKTPGEDLADYFMDTITRNLDPQYMTPRSRDLQAVLSDAVTPTSKRSFGRTGFTPRNGTPGRNISLGFDFPDLPSLKPSSPMSHAEGLPFSELPTEQMYPEFDDMINTDKMMPSSPPVSGGWNVELTANIELEAFDAHDWSFMDENEADNASHLKTPKKGRNHGMLDVETPGRDGLRRSPRRAGRE